MNTYMQTDNDIEATKDSSEARGGLFSNYDLTKFKITPPKSLFPLEKADFKKWLPLMLCPICQKRLYWNSLKTIARCKSKKSKDRFFIKSETLKKYT